MSISKQHGSCLCGDVQFDVELDIAKGSKCNCTWCTKLGVTGSIVKPGAFTLQSPDAKLASFTRTPEIGNRYFCARCHIYCFSKGNLEMLGGAFVSVNMNCLDGFDPTRTVFEYWDGRHDNWGVGTRATAWPIAAAAQP